mgnify:CR=1 FL=1
MKFNLEKLQQLAQPLPDNERQQMEHQIENRDWLLLSVRLAMKIRSLMAAEGISQSELARRMSVTPAQVTKILSGQENLGLKTIAKVETALGKPLFHVDLDDDIDEVMIKERGERNTFMLFIKSQPVAKNLTSAYSEFDINIVAQPAYS